MNRRFAIWIVLNLILTRISAQQTELTFTRADTLRGMLLSERSCYDVNYYHLDIAIDPAHRFIAGSTAMDFRVDSAFDRMQVDLFNNMEVEKIVLDGKTAVPYEREFNAIHVHLPNMLAKDSRHTLVVHYSGNPIVAKNPPWDGGFTWEKDSAGNPWVVVTCQGTGASLWWPNKDHQSDEPDSMLISVTVPKGLEDVSNGRLRAVTDAGGDRTRYDWFVSYPINNYDVTVNVGKFSHFSDRYSGRNSGEPDPLTLDYYVLPEHLDAARKQFGDNVKPMLEAFERYFGKYPFYRDGYKLIESPHTGMEHQTAVAYGNRYVNGYRGYSSSAVGLKFDFIIIHESAHEWWGNSITAKDVADMWIHESFGAYAEALFVEYYYGRDEALKYINNKRQNVGNTSPIVGVYNVQNEGSPEMYDKGQLVLNTLRSVIDNDTLWFSILRGVQQTYAYRTITGDSIIHYINRRTGKNYDAFFAQYLEHAAIPQLDAYLETKDDKTSLRYCWKTDVDGFAMPVKVTLVRGRYDWIYPTTAWQSMELGNIAPEEFKVQNDLFYVNLRLHFRYVDPNDDRR